MSFVRSVAEVDEARRLAALDLPASAIARRLSIPRTTVRDWLNQPVAREPRRLDIAALPEAQYAYLLSLYLGDGHIVATGRTFRLTITLDARYPGIVESAAEALAAALPANAVAVRPHRTTRCVVVSASSNLLPRLFPQHGSGRKHLRTIRLEPWQRTITIREPRALVRGLIHSDGCRYEAVVRRRGRTYRYTRYAFANRSDDIKRILCDHLDQLGVRWTRPNEKDVAIARKADVARMDAFVGPKR